MKASLADSSADEGSPAKKRVGNKTGYGVAASTGLEHHVCICITILYSGSLLLATICIPLYVPLTWALQLLSLLLFCSVVSSASPSPADVLCSVQRAAKKQKKVAW